MEYVTARKSGAASACSRVQCSKRVAQMHRGCGMLTSHTCQGHATHMLATQVFGEGPLQVGAQV